MRSGSLHRTPKLAAPPAQHLHKLSVPSASARSNVAPMLRLSRPPLALLCALLSLAAFGAGVFNQLMEIQPDSRMARTADRPLPAGRITPGAAFAIGWLLSAMSLIHLVHTVNVEAAAITAATLAVYLFIYTPLKQQSDTNTLIGAVSGALPPLIGWVGAAGASPIDSPYFRWQLLIQPGAIYLFALLFLWQLPHFLAINWMYREEYVKKIRLTQRNWEY